jgi:hypothetical protein
MQAIAVFEASKGLAALAAAVGVLELLHQDVHQLALALLWRFHLAPDAHYPALLLHRSHWPTSRCAGSKLTACGATGPGPSGWACCRARCMCRWNWPICCTAPV